MSECYASNDEDGLAVCAAHRWSMAGVAPGGLCIEGRLIKAEAANKRLEAEVVDLSEEVVLAKVALEHAEDRVHRLTAKLAEVRAISAEALAERDATIQRVRELHNMHDPNCPYGEDCAGAGLCLACREEYPCATIRALDGGAE